MYIDPVPEGNQKGKLLYIEDFERMLTEYYGLWGWDTEGRPTKATIEELGLADLG